mgnify:CR=1 FL=1
MQVLHPHDARTQGVDERVAGVGLVEHRLATDVGQAQAVAVAADAGDDAVDDALRVGVVGGAEAQLVHDGHRAGAHRDDVADDAADAGGRALVGLDEAGVVVGLDLVGDGPAVADVDDAGVLAHADEEVLLHLGRDLLAELLEVDLARLVGAVLGPHDRVHGELGAGGTAAEELLDGGVLVVLEAELLVGHLLVRGAGGVLDGVGVLDRDGLRIPLTNQVTVRTGAEPETQGEAPTTSFPVPRVPTTGKLRTTPVRPEPVDVDSHTPDGRTVVIRDFPISIDSRGFHELATSEKVKAEAAKLREDLGNPGTIIFGVDRLDYTKGLRQRIRAVGELFKEGKLDPHEVVFLQLATPSRERVDEYKILRDDINLLVGQINSKAGTIANRALVYRNESVPREVLVAMYQVADLMLVTPVRDGMNLVAKEYIACRSNDDSALVLSEFAGAARELKQAYMVNPYDIDGMKATIMRALTDSPKVKARKMRSMRRQVFDKTIDVWADDFLTELEDR